MQVTDHTRYRIYTVMAIMCAAGLVLIGQLVRWQIVEHHHFSALAEEEHQDELVIPPHRGEIRDRAGHLLAVDIVQYDVSASPKIISKPQAVADRLSRLLEIPREDLVAILTSDKLWVPVAYDVPQAVGETLLEWDLVGLKAEPRTRRVYPEDNLAAHLLGFVNDNGNGFYGVEGFYHSRLRGKPGYKQVSEARLGRSFP